MVTKILADLKICINVLLNQDQRGIEKNLDQGIQEWTDQVKVVEDSL